MITAIYAALAFANVALAIWALVATWRLASLLRHARELDRLLALICVQAFARAHTPIWRAWNHVYGNISIEVTQTRRDAP